MVKDLTKKYGVRRFRAEQAVEKEKLEQILTAAMAAPSAGNQQPWDFYVVTHPDRIQEIMETSPYSHCAVGSTALIVPVILSTDGLPYPQYAETDLSVATENMLLEITKLGLGGVWLGIEDAGAVTEILELSEDEADPFAIVALGYPAEAPQEQPVFRSERVHFVD